MDIPSTGPTSLRSNCTDPTDTEEDDEACGGTGGATDEKVAVSAKAVTTAAAAKRRADTFAQLTSKEELSQAKLILVNDRAWALTMSRLLKIYQYYVKLSVPVSSPTFWKNEKGKFVTFEIYVFPVASDVIWNSTHIARWSENKEYLGPFTNVVI